MAGAWAGARAVAVVVRKDSSRDAVTRRLELQLFLRRIRFFISECCVQYGMMPRWRTKRDDERVLLLLSFSRLVLLTSTQAPSNSDQSHVHPLSFTHVYFYFLTTVNTA